jgi:gluconate 2-dehydrogenase subunit 3-like protein
MDEPIAKIGRRAALKRLATAGAAAVAANALAQTPEQNRAAAALPKPEATPVAPSPPLRPATDPDLISPIVPWPKVLTKEEMRTVTALCDVIIPADEKSPAASAVGVPDFINEWVSAPYPTQQTDQLTVRGGLSWLNIESGKRFDKEFADLSDEQKRAICDDICYEAKAKAEHKVGAKFFEKMRSLTVSGFYTTEEGMKDIQYVGNVPLESFDGPPPAVLKHLGLA